MQINIFILQLLFLIAIHSNCVIQLVHLLLQSFEVYCNLGNFFFSRLEVAIKP